MRIAIDHTLTVAFPFPRPSVALSLRVTPEDHHDQTVSGWRIWPDCDARLRTTRDGYGNVLTMVYAEGPIDGIEFHVTGEVFTGPSNGILSAAHPEPLPPELFLRPGADAVPELTALAVDAGVADDAVERLHLANVALYRRADAVAADILAASFVAAARRLARPARCVSGYLAQGSGSRPHVWAEAYVDGIGWVGFDPVLGLSAGEDHARVASALDLTGIAMVSGV
ncbi:transglutaminase family protein [Sphingomonas panacisoli]|uniref:Transglutaminase family protein n=1 Tax=Sphingomonas panacisoli TaxID=1813879 RepID=A0A5B8LG66_9SPHN|nr:transglutaminase domain-containing protein [Sphingomonas panacisoli]QDZ06765.1 transglutaminase family protein [Sphingomonas panacisoli]